ncbi:flagellar hook-length control protein FliK [Aliarcobacter skirrowii]|uniref:Flagellar hook-length control protein FliK n=1 Tax=Aliarcobacter skirrowii CCUG 10374 TaxID=1032239 RepID=A0AAD0SMW4_9BACT|nr:flagellar hook-length control protein FliK [Aliarcobacter skirrowii]AXX85081.1 flagellar hook-length control protein FliK [Aliarcobacter skirrowii CCUG 10374]KAB0620758.1 flagellar hook-length control protein FliK [Aliarcobacter skirrowii CCUG 10374]RXI25896.1 flagellar hook-length control protein FliK [Aliarcobacter skirrowii CCUG 10374]SUU96394.1 Flagellar hook-length control protein FliK [Aliarcobacter skirrowii]
MLISNQSNLNILLSNNQALLNKILDSSLDSELKSILTNQNSGADVLKIIKELFLALKDGSKSEMNLENLLKNLNFSKELGTLSSNISTLLQNLQSDESLSNLKTPLENFLKNFQNIDDLNLKEQIKNSGVFLENKLLNSSKYNFDDDFKANLLKLQEVLTTKSDAKSIENLKIINNLLAQVELNQLGSLASNSNFVFIPFFWDMLEDGFIQMKQKEKEKFFCQINLNLKDFGKVDLMLFLYDKNKLDLTIYAQREYFKVAIKENLQTLKKALNSVELIAVNVKLLDMKDDKKEDNLEQKYQNFYEESIFSNSIDIKA